MSYTLQEIFDKSARHLLTQNSQSMVVLPKTGLNCAYRSDGKMCAAGPFLTDEEVAGEYNTKNLRYLAERNTHIIERLGGKVGLELLLSLQSVHDHEACTRWWPSLLKRVAETHGVSDSVLKEFSNAVS